MGAPNNIQFVQSLIPQLLAIPASVVNPTYPAMVNFLEWIVMNQDLEAGDESFLTQLANRLKTVNLPAVRKQEQDLLDYFPAQLVAGTPSAGQPAPALPGAVPARLHDPINIDKDFLVGFDLEDLSYQLHRSLGNYQGAYAFTVGNPNATEEIVRNYYLERIPREMKRITERPFHQITYTLNPEALKGGGSLLENAVTTGKKFINLKELLNEYPMDVLLVFWCFYIPRPMVKKLAIKFWEQAKLEAQPIVERSNRLLVTVWANYDGKPISAEQITLLATPRLFDVNKLKAWISGRLAAYQQELGEARIRCCLERLAQTRGYPGQAFMVMEEIINKLQTGRMEAS